MDRNEYRQLRSEQGTQVRNILGMAADERQPATKSQINRALDDAGITDDALRNAIGKDCIELAKRARDGEGGWVLNQVADQLTVGHLKTIATEDSLLGDAPDWSDGDPGSAENQDVLDQVLHHGESDEQREQRRAATAEKDRLRKLGVNVDA